MSDLSIRSLKSSTVSIAKVSDHIQTFFKWSVVPIAALTALGFISSASCQADGPSRGRPQLKSASNAEPDKLRPRFSHQSRGRFFS